MVAHPTDRDPTGFWLSLIIVLTLAVLLKVVVTVIAG